MAELKPYLVSTNPIIANYIKTHPQTVFDEDEYNSNTTRVWISFDIDDKLASIDTRKKLYDWINAYDAESWGNSNATFLLNGWTPDNEYLGDWLISELTTANVLDKTNWKKTKGISLYIQYLTLSDKQEGTFDYFVLIQNKDIPNPNGF